MASQLTISVGQYSDKGKKAINQDFHGLCIPTEPLLSSKGIAIAIADGISSSSVSQIASDSSVRGFLSDYYCTSETWSVKKSVQCVLNASNSWLYSQTKNNQSCYDMDRGYVCTFSALILKSTTAHIFHIGDTRIYRRQGKSLEQLTTDHRLYVSQDKSYLSRALGIQQQVEIDYKSLPIEQGEHYLLASDGVYEFCGHDFMLNTIDALSHDLDLAAQAIVEHALVQGSNDNLTVQIIRIDALPNHKAKDVYQQLTQLPFAPILEARMVFDGYKIIRQLHASSRSHVYLAIDETANQSPNSQTQHLMVIKTPAIDLRCDTAYLERFLLEEWIAKRINSPHVLKPCATKRKRNFLYITSEYIEGQTLYQWIIDNPKPELETVRNIIEQLAKGLRAFHRLEMLHQDLRPENIMIDSNGIVKIIDFGSTRVAGLLEISSPIERCELLGTAQYTAPEYFIGEAGSQGSDLFSLAVITYQMLSARLPYGTQVAKTKTKAQQRRLKYRSVLSDDLPIPAWIDEVLKKALHPLPFKRYSDISEFIADLRKPNQAFLNKTREPLIERHPLGFWQTLCFILFMVIVYLLSK